MNIDLKSHSILSLSGSTKLSPSHKLWCVAVDRLKRNLRNISKQPNFGFVVLLYSEGHKEFGDRAKRGQLVICLQTMPTVRAAELLQNLKLQACLQHLKERFSCSRHKPRCEWYNHHLPHIIFAGLYLIHANSEHPLAITPQVPTLTMSLGGSGIKSLSATGWCWHLDGSARKSAAENSDTEGCGYLLLGGSWVSVLQLITHLSSWGPKRWTGSCIHL